MRVVEIDTNRIKDWESFHQVFKETLGFPHFYGKNGNAWIDCMTYADQADLRMTQVSVEPGDLLVLKVPESEQFKKAYPEHFDALAE